MDFESKFAELEAIVSRLEKGDQPLEAALKDYEKGLALAKACSDMLSEATGRIEKLTKKEGEIQRVPLDESANESEI